MTKKRKLFNELMKGVDAMQQQEGKIALHLVSSTDKLHADSTTKTALRH